MEAIKRGLQILVTIMLMGWMLYGGSAIREGKWSITAQMEAPGMPMVIPPVTKVECIKGEKWLPRVGPVENCTTCRVIEREMEGNVFRWKEECDSAEGKLYAEGKILFESDQLRGDILITQGEMRMTIHLTGKRIGDCQ